MAWSRRNVLRAGGVAALVAATSACSGRDPAQVRIGATATGAPFSFASPDGRELIGAMVDIGRAVVEEAGLTPSIETVPFAALIPSLATRKIDVIAAAMLRTPEREQVVAFSDPVYRYGGGLMVREGEAEHDYASLSDLADRRVAVQIGTRFVDQLAEAGVSDVRTYDNLSDCLRDLSNGRVQVVYGDAPIMKHQAGSEVTAGMRIVEGFTPPALEEVCLVLRKDDTELLERLNQSISRLHDTEIARVIETWNL